MSKGRTIYVCTECGAQASKWSGQCGDCGAWNTLQEAPAPPLAGKGGTKFASYAGSAAGEVRTLADVDATAEVRQSCGNGELDRVLGGGLVHGSVTLIGGDPGIGKSTLLLQVLATGPCTSAARSRPSRSACAPSACNCPATGCGCCRKSTSNGFWPPPRSSSHR